MAAGILVWVLGLTLAGQADSATGVVRGVVVNATHGDQVCAGAEVVLRARVGADFVPVARTRSDALGRFEFRQLDILPGLVYLPGANRGDVHYPGKRLTLTAEQPEASVVLRVHEAVAHPSPLVVRRHDVWITPRAGVVEVTENLTIDNPTLTTYVGQPDRGEQMPVTLTLSIPLDFERTTFHREFFGRNFGIADGKLVTQIPWTPGRRDLAFTYTLRNASSHRVWERMLDLPSDELRVRVKHDRADEVTCNLGKAVESRGGEIVFGGAGGSWPKGHILRVELGRLPVSWSRYARWIAVAALVGIVLAAAVLARRAPGGTSAAAPHSLRLPQGRNQRKRKAPRHGRKAA